MSLPNLAELQEKMRKLPPEQVKAYAENPDPTSPTQVVALMVMNEQDDLRQAMMARQNPAPTTTVLQDKLGAGQSGLGSAPAGFQAGGWVPDFWGRRKAMKVRQAELERQKRADGIGYGWSQEPPSDSPPIGGMRPVGPRPQLHVDPRAPGMTGVIPQVGTGTVAGNIGPRTGLQGHPDIGGIGSIPMRTPYPMPTDDITAAGMPGSPPARARIADAERYGRSPGLAAPPRVPKAGEPYFGVPVPENIIPRPHSGGDRGMVPPVTPRSLTRNVPPLTTDKRITAKDIVGDGGLDPAKQFRAYMEKQYPSLFKDDPLKAANERVFSGSDARHHPGSTPVSREEMERARQKRLFVGPPERPMGIGDAWAMEPASDPVPSEGGIKSIAKPPVVTPRKQMIEPPKIGGAKEARPESASYESLRKKALEDIKMPSSMDKVSQKVANLQAELADEKTKNPGDTMLRIGAAIAGGESRYAATNIGKGILEGLKGVDARDRAQAERELKLLGAETTIKNAEFNMWRSKQEIAHNIANGTLTHAEANRRLSIAEDTNNISLYRAEIERAKLGKSSAFIESMVGIFGGVRPENWTKAQQRIALSAYQAKGNSQTNSQVNSFAAQIARDRKNWRTGKTLPTDLQSKIIPGTEKMNDGKGVPYVAGIMDPTGKYAAQLAEMERQWFTETYGNDPVWVAAIGRSFGAGPSAPQVKKWTGPGSVKP